MASTVSPTPLAGQPRPAGETGSERVAALDLAVAQKRALRASLAHKADAIAPEIGISARALRCAVQDDTDAQLPLRRVPALIQASPDPMPLLQFWCGLVGCLVVKVPRGVDGRPMAEAVREFADLLDAHAHGIEDGGWSLDEVATLAREADEAIVAILAAVEQARRTARRAS
jgi:hypothetical protein